MATASSNESTINLSYFDHFPCNICFEVLREPVQCVENEHYFCKPCITQHLTRSQTCPVCQDHLTTETLRPSSRVVASLLQQFQSPKCRYANRGCTASVRHEVLLSHHEECGFAPVRCSNDGCEETVNRQDLASHERESCEFRPVTREECDERMSQKDYEEHPCVFRKELDDNKRRFAELKKILREMQEEQLRLRRDVQMQWLALGLGQLSTTQSRQGDDLRRQESGVTQLNTTEGQQRNDSEDALISPNLSGTVGSLSSHVQVQPAARDRQFVVAGGGSRSYEVFNWSTQQWTLYENTLFFDHDDGFSFVYDNKIMICGGTSTDRVECLDMTNPRFPSAFPIFLRGKDCGKGVLCGDNILTFGESVSATHLRPPYKSEFHMRYHPSMGKIKLSSYGVAFVSENAVVIVAGYKENLKKNCRELTDDVRLYNPTTKRLEKLAPLPYKVVDMAVLAYNDNIITMGGETAGRTLDDVVMYNITSQECSKLPSMLKARTKCAAVITGDTIVAIGGTDGDDYVDKTEYLVLGENTWKELPATWKHRKGATACVLP